MIWNVPRSSSSCRRTYELVPGDLIFTGTPAGVGALDAATRSSAASMVSVLRTMHRLIDDAKLHTYCRSSAAFRVRIALNFKGIAYEPCRLICCARRRAARDGHIARINPQGLIPALDDADT
jgi:2-keto-4-pentenoate hydratase/2-oxohepta-3-ene-1,7-dioic acid hydratase in catechol pathway